MQCVILAGGLGTRMRPFTEKIPKALIPIDSHPFLHHQLQWISQHGVSEVVLSLGYLGEMIKEFVGDGGRWGLKVQFIDEGTQLRGTGGALRLAVDKGVLLPHFLVTYGDSFLPIDVKAVHEHFLAQSEPALMTVLNNRDRWDRSNVCFDGRKVTLYDKKAEPQPASMTYVDYGLMAFRRSLIETEISSEQVSDLAGLLHRLSKEGRLAGYEVKERFYEIGSSQGLSDLKEFLCHSPN